MDCLTRFFCCVRTTRWWAGGSPAAWCRTARSAASASTTGTEYSLVSSSPFRSRVCFFLVFNLGQDTRWWAPHPLNLDSVFFLVSNLGQNTRWWIHPSHLESVFFLYPISGFFIDILLGTKFNSDFFTYFPIWILKLLSWHKFFWLFSFHDSFSTIFSARKRKCSW